MEELQKLTSEMDVPLLRRDDLRWLQRNLVIRNANHPNFKKVMEMINKMLKPLHPR